MKCNILNIYTLNINKCGNCYVCSFLNKQTFHLMCYLNIVKQYLILKFISLDLPDARESCETFIARHINIVPTTGNLFKIQLLYN